MLVGAASTSHAQTVTFSRIDDAVSSRFFDPATTRPDSINRNKLKIGFHAGIDAATLKSREFKASTASFSYTSAMDAINFRVQAPSGYYIATITYSQRGTGSVLRTGRAGGGTTWTVADSSSSLSTFSTNPTFTRTLDLRSRKLTTVSVSIANSLYAFATPSLGSATVAVTGADVTVTLVPKL
jgi:hypothetical protein